LAIGIDQRTDPSLGALAVDPLRDHATSTWTPYLGGLRGIAHPVTTFLRKCGVL
jgi:hypothetical protein